LNPICRKRDKGLLRDNLENDCEYSLRYEFRYRFFAILLYGLRE